MDFLRILFSPFGRIGRMAYWLGSIFQSIALLLALDLTNFAQTQMSAIRSMPPETLKAHTGDALGLAAVALLSISICLWWGFAIAAKRWHDRGKTGFWVLINLLPLIGPLWQFIECGFLPGTLGRNPYGPPGGIETASNTAEVFS
ncbi:MAG TPA: DUF805 domain-containing protein [Caulobacteraceae bacterium]|nr:DUF805 domain-containing protein [Caulobacteraceae bacterium]